MSDTRLRIVLLAALAIGTAAIAVACGDDDSTGGTTPSVAPDGSSDAIGVPDTAIADAGTLPDAVVSADAADANDGASNVVSAFYAVDGANRLVRFAPTSLGTIVTLSITGLQAAETIHAVDFRRTDGKLYGLGSTSRLYTIDTTTGAATVVAATPFTPALSGTTFAFDWNPVVDRFRVVSDTDQNLRLDPATGALVAVDTSTTYAIGDVNAAANPAVSGCAYLMANAEAGTTVLYDVDTTLDVLTVQNPPNNGSLNTVGPLGIDATSSFGFDIVVEGGVDKAYIVTNPGGSAASTLYTVNLATGAATAVGQVGGAVLHGLTHSL